MKIAIINGTGSCGKDLFVTFCQAILGADRVENYSTVDYVKAVAAMCGWDGAKDDKGRKFLSDLKKLMADYSDIPYQYTKQKIHEFAEHLGTEEGVIFIHCREPQEIQRFVEEFNAHTLLIRRELADEKNWHNASDQSVYDYNYEVIIENNGTIEQLRESAETYLTECLGLNI